MAATPRLRVSSARGWCAWGCPRFSTAVVPGLGPAAAVETEAGLSGQGCAVRGCSLQQRVGRGGGRAAGTCHTRRVAGRRSHSLSVREPEQTRRARPWTWGRPEQPRHPVLGEARPCGNLLPAAAPGASAAQRKETRLARPGHGDQSVGCRGGVARGGGLPEACRGRQPEPAAVPTAPRSLGTGRADFPVGGSRRQPGPGTAAGSAPCRTFRTHTVRSCPGTRSSFLGTCGVVPGPRPPARHPTRRCSGSSQKLA